MRNYKSSWNFSLVWRSWLFHRLRDWSSFYLYISLLILCYVVNCKMVINLVWSSCADFLKCRENHLTINRALGRKGDWSLSRKKYFRLRSAKHTAFTFLLPWRFPKLWKVNARFWCWINCYIVILFTANRWYASLGCWKDTDSFAVDSLEGSDPLLTEPYTMRQKPIDTCAQVAKRHDFKGKVKPFALLALTRGEGGGWVIWILMVHFLVFSNCSLQLMLLTDIE